MLKQVYEIDINGHIAEIYVAEFDESGNPVEELAKDKIVKDPPHGLYRAKWNGTEWVEGETLEERAERESQLLLESLKSSPSQIADAELEIKILTTLTELGVIQ